MKKKVLIVEDKIEFRRLTKIYLSRTYDVLTAGNGIEALALLQNGELPDVIVSDLNMPHVDGKTMVMQLKSSGLYKDIPIIILSSEDKSNNKIELFQMGADDYMVKPYNPLELEVRINKLLAPRQQTN